MAKGSITEKEIKRRAELLLTALELLHEEPEKTMIHEEFIGLLKTAPNSVATCACLVKHNIVSVTPNGRNKATVEYTGIAPNLVVAKKIVEEVLSISREFNAKHRAKKRNNKVSTVAELQEIRVKPAPLDHSGLLREIKILKERYRLSVPTAEVEITVRVSSIASV